MSVSLIKLKNGTEVVGHVNKLTNSSIELLDPMQINYKQAEVSGLPVVSFTKYCPFSTEEIFKFDMEHVLHVTTIKKAAEDYYLEALEFYKNVSSKHLEKELMEAKNNTSTEENNHLTTFLKKVKIDGYAH